MDKSKMFERFTFLPNPWKPMAESKGGESAFIDEDPLNIIQQEKFNKVLKKPLYHYA